MNGPGAELPLRDIHASPPPEWWPPAPGWWALAAVGLIVIVWGAWLLVRELGRRRRQRQVLAELEAIHADWAAHGQDDRFLAELSAFLRRVALALAGRRFAGVTGKRWLLALESLGAEPGTLSAGPGVALIDGPYQPPGAYDAVAVYQAVRRYMDAVRPRFGNGGAGGV